MNANDIDQLLGMAGSLTAGAYLPNDRTWLANARRALSMVPELMRAIRDLRVDLAEAERRELELRCGLKRGGFVDGAPLSLIINP